MSTSKNSIQSLFVKEIIKAVSQPLSKDFDYKVEGSGTNIVTVTEGGAFMAGMIDSLLKTYDLEQLKQCLTDDDQIAIDVVLLRIELD